MVIVHFRPVNGYPPVLNLINLLEKSNDVNKITVLTTNTEKLICCDTKVELISINTNKTRLFRSISYLTFNFYSLISCLSKYNNTLLAYESVSSIPVIIAKRLNHKKKILIHFHEYTTEKEYNNGMNLEKIGHKLFLKNTQEFNWISHTNADRACFFREEFNIKCSVNINSLPNYPPKSWYYGADEFNNVMGGKIKMVIVGSLSYEDTYIKEILNMVQNNKEKYELTIFSSNILINLRKDLKNGISENIIFVEGINYYLLPNELKKFDLGIIPYKPTTKNVIFCVPNKFHEYYSVGLNILYPKEMISCKNFVIENNLQDIAFEMNFEQPIEIIHKYKPKKIFSCDDALIPLFNEMDITI